MVVALLPGATSKYPACLACSARSSCAHQGRKTSFRQCGGSKMNGETTTILGIGGMMHQIIHIQCPMSLCPYIWFKQCHIWRGRPNTFNSSARSARKKNFATDISDAFFARDHYWVLRMWDITAHFGNGSGAATSWPWRQSSADHIVKIYQEVRKSNSAKIKMQLNESLMPYLRIQTPALCLPRIVMVCFENWRLKHTETVCTAHLPGLCHQLFLFLCHLYLCLHLCLCPLSVCPFPFGLSKGAYRTASDVSQASHCRPLPFPLSPLLCPSRRWTSDSLQTLNTCQNCLSLIGARQNVRAPAERRRHFAREQPQFLELSCPEWKELRASGCTQHHHWNSISSLCSTSKEYARPFWPKKSIHPKFILVKVVKFGHLHWVYCRRGLSFRYLRRI